MMLDNSPDERMAHLARQAEIYARQTFGAPLNLHEVALEGVPYFLTDRYQLWLGDILDRPAVFMANRTGPLDLADIAKHRALACKSLGVTLGVLVLSGVDPRARRRLIEHRIAFLAPGAQCYVPEVLLDLREGGRIPVMDVSEHLSPTAQLVVLGALLGVEIDQASLTDLAERFQVSVMSISRALDELVALGVAEDTWSGRRRQPHLTRTGQDLWTTLQDRLQSPVRKVRLVRGEIALSDAPLGGESALARYTMLAAPRTERRAVLASNWLRMARHLELEPATTYDEERLEIETWSYNPQVLSRGDLVDRFSLYLSVRHEPDERVAQAARQLLEDVAW